MKISTNYLIVVEGKTDIDFLSTFLDAKFYKVNGSAVSKNDIEFLKKAKSSHDIVILTDPDFPGMKIRNYLNSEIDGLKNAYVRKEYSIKNHKVGVAESTKEEVIRALENTITFNKNVCSNNINVEDLFELGLLGRSNSSALRKKVADDLFLGYCNAKSFLKKVNMLNISKEQIKELINAKNKWDYWFF